MSDQPTNISLKIHSSDCNSVQACPCPSLEKTKSIKYLGVIIDQHLRWREHVAHVAKRIRSLMPKFYLLRDILSKKP